MFARVARSAWPRALGVVSTAAGLGAAGAAACDANIPGRRSAQEAQVTSEKSIASTDFIKVKTMAWTDEKGVGRHWDMVSREGFTGAVSVVAILRHPSVPNAESEVLLTCQFKPPVGLVLELPSTLMSPGESAAEAAVRALRQETGYLGVARAPNKRLGGAFCTSPGLTDETKRIVVVNVDLSEAGNHKPSARSASNYKERKRVHWQPHQDLQHGDFITVHRVKVSELELAIENAQSVGIKTSLLVAGLATGLGLGA